MKDCEHLNQVVIKEDKEALQICMHCDLVMARWNDKTSRMAFLAPCRRKEEVTDNQ